MVGSLHLKTSLFVLVERYKMPAIVMASVDGHSQVAAKQENVNTSQGFVAMWFDDSMTEAYEKGIQPAIEDAGYKAMRIDQKEHANKIDDEIIAEIRRSRFIVADFSHGGDGARGGVYYEAGFAHGLKSQSSSRATRISWRPSTSTPGSTATSFGRRLKT